MFSGYPIWSSHYGLLRQIEVHFDRRPLAIEIVHHVEGTKATTAPQSIAREIRGQCFVHCFRRNQRWRSSWMQTPFACRLYLFQRAINAIDTLWFQPWLRRRSRLNNLLHLCSGRCQANSSSSLIIGPCDSIVIRSDRPSVVNRASLPFTQPMLCLQHSDQLTLRGWPYSFLRSHLSAHDSPAIDPHISVLSDGFHLSSSRSMNKLNLFH